MNIAYFVDTFPATSETFVINEIDEMSKHERDIYVVSVNTPTTEVPHMLAKTWARKTTYLSDVRYFFLKNLFAMLSLAFLHPRRFAYAVTRSRRFDKAVAWKFRRVFWLANYVRRMRTQHIHVHFACEAAEMAWMTNWLTEIPFSVSTHGYDIYVKPYRFMAALSADATFVRSVCTFNMDALQEMGVAPDKMPVIHCGIRTEQFAPAVGTEKDIDIVCVARLHPVKGISTLIDAVASIAPEMPMVRVSIAGDGPERDALEAQVKMHNLTNNIELLGSCSQEEVRSLLARSKVFCLPSLGDSVGVATMEAMAMGVPVVSTTVKGIPELVEHGKSGLLVPPGDAEALGNALRRLLLDADYRNKLSVAAFKDVSQNFNQEIEVVKLRNKMREKI